VEAICPDCGTRRAVLVDGELTLAGAVISLCVDFFLLGPLVILGFFDHDPVETTCPECGRKYRVRLNMRLRTYASPSYVYTFIVYTMLTAVLLILIFGWR
jgi:hypothetical protein